MAINKVSSGERISISQAGVQSGDIVMIENLKGIALIDTNDRGETVIETRGIFFLEAQAVNGGSGEAIAVGDNLYYSSARGLTKTNSDPFFGIALEEVTISETADIKVFIP